MTPLLFVWPWWPLFWAVWFWAFLPEFTIVRKAGKAAKQPGSRDAGSVKVIALGGSLAMFIAFPLAWVQALRVPVAWDPAVYVIGVATIVAASLLRRHCWRLLGASFTGEVRASADQKIVATGAYTLLRHPSYTAGILMSVGIGLALGNWASLALVTVAAFAVYAYRIAVEEQALLQVVGEPYRQFATTRKRLIPFIY